MDSRSIFLHLCGDQTGVRILEFCESTGVLRPLWPLQNKGVPRKAPGAMQSPYQN